MLPLLPAPLLAGVHRLTRKFRTSLAAYSFRQAVEAASLGTLGLGLGSGSGLRFYSLYRTAVGGLGLGYQFCMSAVSWRHAFRSERPFIVTIIIIGQP